MIIGWGALLHISLLDAVSLFFLNLLLLLSFFFLFFELANMYLIDWLHISSVKSHLIFH